MSEKGATKFDKICHKIYEANADGVDYYAREVGIACEHCGHELEVYYCEDRLYVVKCRCCQTITLVKDKSPADAAYRARATALYPAWDMDTEAAAVFWGTCPAEDMPEYTGTMNDYDFPEEMKIGMYLPYPGTNGEELLGRLNEIEMEMNDERTD